MKVHVRVEQLIDLPVYRKGKTILFQVLPRESGIGRKYGIPYRTHHITTSKKKNQGENGGEEEEEEKREREELEHQRKYPNKVKSRRSGNVIRYSTIQVMWWGANIIDN